ncbi:MAG: hypothetical protein U1D06_00630, partial [Paracoccaceae bacterium]|nr:hypothetical protein [Paracoccaceae bacterium]
MQAKPLSTKSGGQPLEIPRDLPDESPAPTPTETPFAPPRETPEAPPLDVPEAPPPDTPEAPPEMPDQPTGKVLKYPKLARGAVAC